MFIKSLFIIPIFYILLLSPTKAADDPYEAMQKFATVTSTTINSAGCLVTASADFDESKKYFALFREEWLSRDYSVDFYLLRAKQVFVYIILKRLAELITEGVYAHGGPPECSFSISVNYSDSLGQARTLEAITWKFTQKRASEVNWIKIDPKNFADVALQYKFSENVSDWIAGEPSLEENRAPNGNCDEKFLRANAIFVRATSYCAKDYMDSPEAYYALAMSRQCVQILSDVQIKSAFLSATKEIDEIAKKNGRVGACRFVEQIKREIGQMAVPPP